MANVSVFNMEGQEVGTIDLNDAIFGVEVNENLIHMAVVQQLANKRQGTQKAKTRGEVSGGGRKPWRQKGTGHARQGSTRAPQWKGGGVVFAPVPRDYSFKMNKKEKRAALKSALTDRLQEGKLIVLDELKFDEIKTKAFANTGHHQGCCREDRGGVRIMATLEYYDILLKPVITEKSMELMAEKKYTFLVHPDANKYQIKTAVERLFEGTKVEKVNTLNADGKRKRRGMVYGLTAKTKKAIVKLTEDSKDIEVFTGL